MAFSLPAPAPTFKFFHKPAYKPAPAHAPAPAHHPPAPVFNPEPVYKPASACYPIPVPDFFTSGPTSELTPAQELILIEEIQKVSRFCNECPLEESPKGELHESYCAELRVRIRDIDSYPPPDIDSFLLYDNLPGNPPYKSANPGGELVPIKPLSEFTEAELDDYKAAKAERVKDLELQAKFEPLFKLLISLVEPLIVESIG